jgi:hypothetical protein
MRQILHIFRKDARHFWPYAAVVAGLTAMLAYLDPQTTPFYHPWSASQIVEVLHIVLVLAWWFTIAAVVHDETPAGDRQFWLTRPYSRLSIVAAKALFVLVFLTLPLVAADCVILSAKGFAPLALAPAMLWRQCAIAAVLLVPPFAFAALTRDLRQFVLAVLLIAVALSAATEFDVDYTHGSMLLRGLAPSLPFGELWRAWDFWQDALWPAGFLLLAVWQYARRRTVAGRCLAAACLLLTFLPNPWSSLAASLALGKSAAAAGAYPGVRIEFVAGRHYDGPSSSDVILSGQGNEEKEQVRIPIQALGRDADLLDVYPVSVAIVPPAGEPWHAGWTMPGRDWMVLRFDSPTLQRLSAGRVTLHAVFDVVVDETVSSVRFRPSSLWHTVPGLGAVKMEWLYGEYPYLIRRMPLRRDVAKWRYTAETPGGAVVHREENGSGVTGPLDFALSPVNEFAGMANGRYGARLPPGAEIVFTVKRPIAAIRRDLVIPDLRLADYIVR